jgi:hypothetical protein
MARELPRVLTALGAVIAAVGLTVFGMGMSYREPRDTDVTIGIVLMILGLAGFIVGLAMPRMGFAGSDRVRVAPAEPAHRRQAVHPPSAAAPEAARHEGDQEGRSRSER